MGKQVNRYIKDVSKNIEKVAPFHEGSDIVAVGSFALLEVLQAVPHDKRHHAVRHVGIHCGAAAAATLRISPFALVLLSRRLDGCQGGWDWVTCSTYSLLTAHPWGLRSPVCMDTACIAA